MIANIIDNRKRKHRWKTVFAIAEPTFQDNNVEDSDQAPVLQGVSCYEEIRDVSIEAAIQWANEFDYPVTLFLRDRDAMQESK